MNPMQVIEKLGVPGRLPVEAIRAAQADRETMVPAFLRTIDDFLELKGPVDPNALFLIFHLLGEWREKSAYWPLAVFLRLPPDVLNSILGEAITETTHRVMAAVFDGDPDPLYQIIRDPEADEFIRAKMCQTIAMLTLRGELPREATASFLRDCFAQLEPQTNCYAWSGWIDAVAWLGLAELRPLVQQAIKREAVNPQWVTLRDFDKALQYAVDHPEAEPLRADRYFAPFDDTIAEMSGWSGFKPQSPRTEKPGALNFRGTPHLVASRKIGRNDPCPCGSGKKFKKCCLNATADPLFENALPWESDMPSIRNRQSS